MRATFWEQVKETREVFAKFFVKSRVPTARRHKHHHKPRQENAQRDLH
jgi:hypothetical protein